MSGAEVEIVDEVTDDGGEQCRNSLTSSRARWMSLMKSLTPADAVMTSGAMFEMS